MKSYSNCVKNNAKAVGSFVKKAWTGTLTGIKTLGRTAKDCLSSTKNLGKCVVSSWDHAVKAAKSSQAFVKNAVTKVGTFVKGIPGKVLIRFLLS